MPLTRRAFAAVLIALAAFALPVFAHAAPPRVFAAASLTDAMNEIGALYTAKGHEKPLFNYASSAALARQIEQGAPADVFLSADEDWMDYLAARKLIDPATRKSILGNTLVLVAPIDRPLAVKIEPGMDLRGALGGGKLAMADPDSVPAGKYGKAALQALGAWSTVEGAVVRAENVRAALRFVELGEAAGGIVYLTDQIAAKDKVALVGAFPAASHPKISYPMAAVRGGNAAEAKKFAAFLQGAEAKAVFARLGFAVR